MPPSSPAQWLARAEEALQLLRRVAVAVEAQTKPASIAERRARLGSAAIYSLSEAAQLLPGSDKECRAWLRAQGLVRPGPGGDVVRWDEVQAQLTLGAQFQLQARPEATAAPAHRTSGRRRRAGGRRGSAALVPIP